MAKRDYYEVLGVDKGADAAAIKTAYRRLAMKHHPDRNPDSPDAEQKFKEVQEAYSCLSDEQKRAAYDRFGHDAFEGGGGFGGGGGGGFGSFFDDVFSDFFGGGQGRGRGGKRQRVMDINLSFEEMALGCEKEIRISIPGACEECDGSGAAAGTSASVCGRCEGNGQVRVQHSVFTIQQTCSACGGSGRYIETPCDNCGGSGSENKTRNLQVNIPAGIDDGALVRVSINSSSEELYIRPNVSKHPLFVRDGDNLHMEVPISMVTAALGSEVIIPSIKGGKLKVSIPEGTQSGQVLRVSDGGIPNVRSGRRGNLMCHIMVETPVKLNSEQKELLKQFSKSLKTTTHSPKERSWLEKAKRFFTE